MRLNSFQRMWSLAAIFCGVMIAGGPESAQWFWSSKPQCTPLDTLCLTDGALADLDTLFGEAQARNLGEALGAVWGHLDADTLDELTADHLSTPESADIRRRLGTELANRYISVGSPVQDLTSLLDDPSWAGNLPIDYLAAKIASDALRTDPSGTADLAIEKGAQFSGLAIDNLYQTIAWMARNDLPRLQAYLETNTPPRAFYFHPAGHLFRIAAEQCEVGENASELRELAHDLLSEMPTTDLEERALPMRAIAECDGVLAAEQAVEGLLEGLQADLPRLAQLGGVARQEVVQIVNDDGLIPVIRALDRVGQSAAAEALARKLLSEEQLIVILQDGGVAARRENTTISLGSVLKRYTEPSRNLDNITALKWFVSDFDPETFTTPANYAQFAIDDILQAWPDPLALAATDKARPILADYRFGAQDLLRLDIGMARLTASACTMSEEAMEDILLRIEDLEKPAARVSATADYLNYVALYVPGLPVCDP